MRFHRPATTLGLLLASGYGVAGQPVENSGIHLHPGVTEISQEVYLLHNIVLWVVCLIGLLVLGLVLYSAIQHRRSKRPEAAHFHKNLSLEIFWTVIPFFILIALAIPATRLMTKMGDTAEAGLTIRVVASSTGWHYEYLAEGDGEDPGLHVFSHDPGTEKGGAPATVRPLIMPAGVKVHWLITADDGVSRELYLPDFAIRKYAAPGLVSEAWVQVPEDRAGVYVSRCVGRCVEDQGFIPLEVQVLPRVGFEAWLAEEKEKTASHPGPAPLRGDPLPPARLGQ